jgi:hypothetical protein
MLDLGRLFGSLVDPLELAKRLVTEIGGAFARPLIRKWYLDLGDAARARFVRRFRQLAQAMDLEPPSLEQLRERRRKLEAQIASYEQHGPPAPLDAAGAADDVARIGGEIVEEIRL